MAKVIGKKAQELAGGGESGRIGQILLVDLLGDLLFH